MNELFYRSLTGNYTAVSLILTFSSLKSIAEEAEGIMKPKTLIFLVVLSMFCQSLTATKTPSAENKETLLSVQLAGGCCGPVNADCGKCTPKGQMPNFETGYSCSVASDRRGRRKETFRHKPSVLVL